MKEAMKLPVTIKGIMKTRILTAISAVTLAAFTLTAGEVVLSPRAKDQVRTATGTTFESYSAAVNSAKLESPRAATSKITVVSGSETVMPAKCAAVGTPRQSDMFASCCKVAAANCKATPAACCKE
jgi:hypothetical protein